LSRRRKGRLLDGVLVVDKPQGTSSNHVLQRAKRLYGAAKAGHTGALDPLATGVLPLCFGEATKFSQYLLDADKTYVTTASLGVRTETSDSEGEPVSEKPVPAFTAAEVEAVLARFRGDIEQVPSMYSALKYEGKPLYRYAREGKTVPRKSRPLTIYQLELLGMTADTLELRVHCSKGTYIRTLVDDIGEALGCGAHVSALRRTQAGAFTLADAVTLDALEEQTAEARDQQLLPADQLIAELPRQELVSEQIVSILHGQPVRISAPGFSGPCRLYGGERFLGLGEVQPDGELKPRRLVSTQ